MNESILESLYSELDWAVFSTVDNQVFTCLTNPPNWLHAFYPEINRNQQIDSDAFFPFLQNFLFDAAEHWLKEEAGPFKSGAWVEQDDKGKEWPLEASAITVQHTKILLIACLEGEFDEQQAQLQQVRNQLLTHEQLELEVHRRTQQIRQREEEIAIRLISASDFRDEETGAHVRRIGLFSAEMAKALDWSQHEIDEIKLAAPMHDVGKIGIPDRILMKPGRLDDAEFEIMKAHARIGQEMLSGSDIPMLEMAKQIAGSHHEKWDGSGYPYGLKGEDIPIAARIVAIADVYDALVHKRVYKNAFREEHSLAIMAEMAGSHLDENLYEVFLSIIDKIRSINNDILDD